MEEYISLGNEYYLNSDKYNYILSKKIMLKGEPIYRGVAYFSTLEQLYKYLIESEIRENLNVLNNIDEVLKLVNENCKKILEVSKNLKKSLNSEE